MTPGQVQDLNNKKVNDLRIIFWNKCIEGLSGMLRGGGLLCSCSAPTSCHGVKFKTRLLPYSLSRSAWPRLGHGSNINMVSRSVNNA